MYPEYDVKRGDIFSANLGSNIGSVQGGKRPVLIVSNDVNNRFCSTVNVIPLSSKVTKMMPMHVIIPRSCGLLEDSIALPEQIQTISKKQLINKLCEVPNEIMMKIDRARDLQLGELVDVGYINKLLYFINESAERYNKYGDDYFIETKESYECQLRKYCETYNINFNIVINKRIIKTIYFTRDGAVVNE